MFGLKALTEIRLYPDAVYIEIHTRVFNYGSLPQTFLWWANPAYAVNENTATIMPPDVTAVLDHGKRAVSEYPIAKGTYYKMDYSDGIDISRYKTFPFQLRLWRINPISILSAAMITESRRACSM